jgi:hypothetical protein
MFQICVLDITFPILFLNAMIRKIKIHNNLDIIEISKFIEPNKCIHKIIYEFFYLHFLLFFKI